MPFPTMTTTQQFDVTIAPTDSKGRPAPVDGDPTWASSDESIAKVVPKPGTLIATVVAQGKGDYSVTCSADANLDPTAVTTVTGSDTGSVSQGTAVAIGLTAGPVVEQP